MCVRNDVLAVGVNCVNRTRRERSGVSARIRAGGTSFDSTSGEISISRSALETRDAVLFALVCSGTGIGSQLDVLVIIERDYIAISLIKGDRFGIAANRRIPIDRNRLLSDFLKRIKRNILTIDRLGDSNLCFAVIPNVFNRVASNVPLINKIYSLGFMRHNLHRFRICFDVGIAWNLLFEAREIEFLVCCPRGSRRCTNPGNLFAIRVNIVEFKRTKRAKVDVTIKVPSPLVASRLGIIRSAGSRLQTSRLARMLPIDVSKVNAINIVQINVVRIPQSCDGLFVIFTRSVVGLATALRIADALNPDATNGIPTIRVHH